MIDPALNILPAQVRRIHLIAVCGTAMGALACMLKDSGYSVSGSDQHVYPPMSTFLEGKGIDILHGYEAVHIDSDIDLVVVGNAVSRDNPEVVEMIRKRLPYVSMPQALNGLVAGGKAPILVTGTHGKTTTSALLAWLLQCAGLDPTFMIGGILRNFGGNYRLGAGPFIVIEGDEYDTAFFDKGPKFLHYTPRAAIITSIEFDHADIYRDLAHVREAFDRLLTGLPANCDLAAYHEDDRVMEAIRNRVCRVHTYGRENGADWRMAEEGIDPPWSEFTVFHGGNAWGTFRTLMMGRHNLLNATAAIAVAHALGIGRDSIREALETFQGVKRRQEVRGVKNNITVIDDFAHHPTAVRETIGAVKPFFPKGRLIAVFEPRTNTSMRRVFQDVYPAAFDAADIICIRKPPLLKKVPDGERFSSEQLVADMRERGLDAHFFEDTEGIIAFVPGQAGPGDCVLIMSNGGFDDIHARLLKML